MVVLGDPSFHSTETIQISIPHRPYSSCLTKPIEGFIEFAWLDRIHCRCPFHVLEVLVQTRPNSATSPHPHSRTPRKENSNKSRPSTHHLAELHYSFVVGKGRGSPEEIDNASQNEWSLQRRTTAKSPPSTAWRERRAQALPHSQAAVRCARFHLAQSSCLAGVGRISRAYSCRAKAPVSLSPTSS